MLRTLFLLLVLGNVLLLALSRGYLGTPDDGREPQRMTSQLHPEKIRIAGEAQAGGPTPVPAPESPAPSAAECVPAMSHWVHMPDLAGRAAAEKKAGELRQLGVNDFHILEGSEGGKFSISLGVFDSPEAAAEFLKGLNRKGVRSARIEARPKPDGCPR